MVNDGMAEADMRVIDAARLWGVYRCVCLKCQYRCVSVAPVATEDVPLWECSQGCGMTMQWTPVGDEDGE